MSFWVWIVPRTTFDEPTDEFGLKVALIHLWVATFNEVPVGQDSQALDNRLKKGWSAGQAEQEPEITKGSYWAHSVPLPEKYESMSFCVCPSSKITFGEPATKLGLYIVEHLWDVELNGDPIGQA